VCCFVVTFIVVKTQNTTMLTFLLKQKFALSGFSETTIMKLNHGKGKYGDGNKCSKLCELKRSKAIIDETKLNYEH
jgi:hypothetical protein